MASPARSVTAARRSGDKDETLVAQVFRALADGRFHSGEELAQVLGVSRSAIWKATSALRDLGATLHAVRNRGYRLAAGRGALDAAKIRDELPQSVREHVAAVDTLWSIESTNAALLERPNPPAGKSEILLAEYQSAGRGRRGRAWLAPPGGAICLSLSWTFREVPEDLGALGLIIGVCCLRALGKLGAQDLTLKWPNDVLCRGRKLGGVLIELRAESQGPACVVVGIGLNMALGSALIDQIAASGTEATDLNDAGLDKVSRNQVAAELIGACLQGLIAFEREGLKPFIAEWRDVDALHGRPVSVSGADGVAKGLARGIDLHGALLLETPQGIRRFISGDVTVRPA
jgi:BirA family biotin operon repressor/biotin-[acetyl-CoA-carboxylase] ligase